MTLSSPSKVTYTSDRSNLSPVIGVKNHPKKNSKPLSPQPPAPSSRHEAKDARFISRCKTTTLHFIGRSDNIRETI
jgi:hypothetical protein